MLSHEYCPQISITSQLFFFPFFFKVYLLTSDLFVDSVNSSVAWLNVRCWGVAEERSVVDNGRPETGR